MMKALNNNTHPLESLLKQHCPNGVEYKVVGEVTIQKTFKQLGASELEKGLKTNNGNIHLLPSSNNNYWDNNEELCKK